jgi:hypothetical protein
VYASEYLKPHHGQEKDKERYGVCPAVLVPGVVDEREMVFSFESLCLVAVKVKRRRCEAVTKVERQGKEGKEGKETRAKSSNVRLELPVLVVVFKGERLVGLGRSTESNR